MQLCLNLQQICGLQPAARAHTSNSTPYCSGPLPISTSQTIIIDDTPGNPTEQYDVGLRLMQSFPGAEKGDFEAKQTGAMYG